MNFLSLVALEWKKIRRSKIGLILLLPVVILWIPSVLNAELNFDTRGIQIAPENNFLIQGFMGMVWFMMPAFLVVCTVLLTQIERSGKGLVKMLSLPVSAAKLCLAKFMVLLSLLFIQMCLCVAAYLLSAGIASRLYDYPFLLPFFEVAKLALALFVGAIPMAAVFWLLASVITAPVFSVGAGLASIVPSVFMLNTKIWFLYPMCYPFYLLMVAYGRAADGVYDQQIQYLPWLPIAALITIGALGLAAWRFGAAERK